MLTVEINGVSFEVDGNYQPEEKEVLYYSDGSGYPGCPASIEVTKILYKDQDVTELIFELFGSEEIEDAYLERMDEINQQSIDEYYEYRR
jgi:hypothetical protein